MCWVFGYLAIRLVGCLGELGVGLSVLGLLGVLCLSVVLLVIGLLFVFGGAGLFGFGGAGLLGCWLLGVISLLLWLYCIVLYVRYMYKVFL